MVHRQLPLDVGSVSRSNRLAMNIETKTRCARHIVCGQPSWRLASSEVEAFVTEMGGHLGPVTFDRSDRRLQPYSVAPWAEEENDPPLRPVTKALRGDFFCMPFGGNATPFRGERHPVHGETANARWRFESLETREGRTSLHLSLKTKIRPGRVDKEISLLRGQNTLYCQHVVTGASGPMSLGHHAMSSSPIGRAADWCLRAVLCTPRSCHGLLNSRRNGATRA